jgi:hypothetical protein
MSRSGIASVLVVNLKSLPTWHLDVAEGFESCGVQARTFVTTPQTLAERTERALRRRKWYDSPLVLERLIATCRSVRPTMILFLGMFVLPEAVVIALRHRLPHPPLLAGWVCDCFREPQFEPWLPAEHVFYFDTFMETVLPGYYPDRSRMSFLPLAANPARYRPLTVTARRNELLFVGNVSPDRRAMLAALAAHVPLCVHGPNAAASGFNRRRKLTAEAINGLYNAHRIVLNINQAGHTEWGANLRVFEATASGALVLTQDCPDLVRHFEPGRELLAYTSPADLIAQYRDFIAAPARCAAVAGAGMRRALADHTFVARATTMLAALR